MRNQLSVISCQPQEQGSERLLEACVMSRNKMAYRGAVGF